MYASVVVIVVLGGAFAYYYVTATGTIASLNSSISSQQGVIGAQASTIGQQSSTIGEQSSSIAFFQANVTAYRAVVTSLNSLIATDTAEINTLNVQVAADNATITLLHSQISTANSMIANLTAEVNLQKSAVYLNGQSKTLYSINDLVVAPFLSFSAMDAGYLLVTVANPTTPGILVDMEYTPTVGNSQNVAFSSLFLENAFSPTVSYIVIPILPGNANQFFLFNIGSTDGTGSVSATYFY